MSTVFNIWGFEATGSTTKRTLPDRVNVKDWGAVGDGSVLAVAPKFAVVASPAFLAIEQAKYGPAASAANEKPPVPVAGSWLAGTSLFQFPAPTLHHIFWAVKSTAIPSQSPSTQVAAVPITETFRQTVPSPAQPMLLLSPPTKFPSSGYEALAKPFVVPEGAPAIMSV